MSEIKWVKIDVSMMDNRKIKRIKRMENGDKIVLCWVWLICLAGSLNRGGKLYYTDSEAYDISNLACCLGYTEEEMGRYIRAFIDNRMVEVNDGVIEIVNWDKYQNAEQMEVIRSLNEKKAEENRQKNRERQKRWYDKKKQESQDLPQDDLPMELSKREA